MISLPVIRPPRNKEIIRIFRDLEIVEHLGSGIPRILDAYGKEAFQISGNFMRLVFPYPEDLINKQQESKTKEGQRDKFGMISERNRNNFQNSQPESQPESLEIRILKILIERNKSKKEISELLGQKQISGQLNIVINRLVSTQMIEYTIPDKPNSRLQKYRLTAKGKALLDRRVDHA